MVNKSTLIKPLTEDQQNVVAMLEETLEQAKRGAFDAIAIVVCMQNGYSHAMTGRRASDLFMGAGALQKSILDEVEGGNRRGNILRI